RAVLTAQTLALVVGASFLNAYGWEQVVYPFRYAADSALTDFNLEWEPTVLVDEVGFALVLAVGFIGTALSARPRELRDLILPLAFAAFGLSARRHVGLASLVVLATTFPAALDAFRNWDPVPRVRQLIPRFTQPRFATPLAIVSVIAVHAGLGRLPHRSVFALDPGLEPPIEASQFIEDEDVPRPLLNQYRWGSFLLYRFAEGEAVAFVDGRNDLYGSEFMRDYLAILEGRQNYRELLDHYGVQSVLLELNETNWRLLRLLIDDGWVCVHTSRASGAGVIVLTRNTDRARTLIERFGRPIKIPPPPPR
ncbi:MAG: hypothetical protein KDC38_11660, partial [Planctomycetes bacterium]|nr:hypothetical protein [Planctomycetota bacterium]